MTEESRYSLIVSFPDQSESFCYGFEAGRIWERMKSGKEAEIEETTRIENREVLRRCAVALGWSITYEPSEIEGWDYTKLEKIEAPKVNNPFGFTVIEGNKDET